MTKFLSVFLLAGLFGQAAAAEQAPLTGMLGAYYTDANVNNAGAAPDGEGHARGLVGELGKDWLYAYFQYEEPRFDLKLAPGVKERVEAEELRLGVGARKRFQRGQAFVGVERFSQKLKFQNLPADGSDFGVGVHVGGDYLVTLLADKFPLVVFGDLGVFELKHSSAREVRVGLKTMLTPHLGAMVSYRRFEQDLDAEPDMTLTGPMVGIAWLF
ncbi:hypothetical protein [Pseudomonas sp. zfem002]|uniref:hypothetical protein n=1 Tax=Pseudomonas sp. zfem002 TaxID=3078197 RepID=UPI002928F188|nr:hypothetical protein [Pseudomonas sp. zfem002]MDU9391945.1 hypothetical protein [Pseudomonas sp. zfem002]